MNCDTVIEAIGTVLREQMRHSHLDRFGPDARLNEDLYLDSVQLLQLILELEMALDLSVSEEMVSRQDIATVADLAALLVPDAERGQEAQETRVQAVASEAPSEGVHGEMPYDLKIHCFVSCVCDGLKKRGIDHRPFYALVWDAEFSITDGSRLAYHSEVMDHEAFRYWFGRLYGVPLHSWYDHSRSKEENVAYLLKLLENQAPGESIMVMLDMFHLPGRENKFNQNPFPHYLMLELTDDPALWQVRDPDFRWEGPIARDKLLNAIRQPTVAGGYRFDPSLAQPPRAEDLAAFFEACLRLDANPLIDATRAIVSAHAEGRNSLRLDDVGEALRELPVVTIRKWAYEHGFAFFWRALRWPDNQFQAVCDEIEVLVNGLTAVHYSVLKLAKTGDRTLIPPVLEKLDELDAVEFSIKRQLAAAKDAWRTASPDLAHPEPVRGALLA
ncbi:DUF6005 family protein [Boseaceae bacterium BT-24-1]|nr:DUF6005 family protein [Boseaceae bacterium BT-24-1]